MRSDQVFTDKQQGKQPDKTLGQKAMEIAAGVPKAMHDGIARTAFGPEMQALYRQGREDLINTLWGQNLDREPGAPGEPTQMIVTDQIREAEHTQEKERGR